MRDEVPDWGDEEAGAELPMLGGVGWGVLEERAPEGGGSFDNVLLEGSGWAKSASVFADLDRDDFLNIGCLALLKDHKQCVVCVEHKIVFY